MAISLKKTGKTKDFFALDIGSSSVKVIQLQAHGSGSRRTWTVTGLGQAPINRSIVADKVVVNAEGLGQAIDAALRAAGIRSKTTWTTLPKSQAVSKIFSIPAGLSVLEQEDQVALEAVNHIPFALDSVSYDHEILGYAKDPGTGETNIEAVDVLFVAAKTENVDNLSNALAESNYEIEVLDVDDLAVERGMRWLINQAPMTGVEDPIEAVIDLGHEMAIIHVLQDGRTIYSREQPFGMKHLTDEASKRYGLTAEKVEAALAQDGTRGDDIPESFESEVVAPFRGEVASTVNRMIQYFFASTSYNRVHRIWLLGGGAGLAGVVQEVADATGVPTRVANPFEHLNTASGIDSQDIHRWGPAYLQAFGLAIHATPTETSLIELSSNQVPGKGKGKGKGKTVSVQSTEPNLYGGVNLIPWRAARRKALQTDFIGKLALAAGLGAVAAGAIWLFLAGQISGQERRNAWVSERIEEANKSLEEINDLERERNALLGRKQVIERLQADRDLLPRILFEAANANVDGTMVTGYEHKANTFNIYGKATSNAAVAALARNLERSAWFTRPEIVVIKNEVDTGDTGIAGVKVSEGRSVSGALNTAENAAKGGNEERKLALSSRYTYVFTVRAGIVNPDAPAEEEKTESKPKAADGKRQRK